LNKKDQLVNDLQSRLINQREQMDQRFLEQKSAFLECQKELAGAENLVELLRGSVAQLEQGKKESNATIKAKDDMIDKLKEELILLNRNFSVSLKSQPKDDSLYEERSKLEFGRLKEYSIQLREAEVEAERLKFDSLAKDREYLKLKQLLKENRELLAGAEAANDQLKSENGKLNEEIEKFYVDLKEMRDIYEGQITQLSSRLANTSELYVKEKEASNDKINEINELKVRLNEFKRRLNERDIEVQELISKKVFDLAQMDSLKLRPAEKGKETPSDNNSKGLIEDENVRIETNYKLHMQPPQSYSEERGKSENTIGKKAEEGRKLEWDGLFHRMQQIGGRLDEKM
jgi:chromosome segregation ATPase